MTLRPAPIRLRALALLAALAAGLGLDPSPPALAAGGGAATLGQGHGLGTFRYPPGSGPAAKPAVEDDSEPDLSVPEPSPVIRVNAPSTPDDRVLEDARFDVYFLGVLSGSLRFTLKEGAQGYVATSRAVTAGAVGALYKASYEAQAWGVDAGPKPRPERFEAEGAFSGDRIALAIDFDKTAPSAVSAEPPFKPKPYEIDPREQTGVLDPLSAAALMLRPAPAAEICGRTADVFDGRRRSRIALAPPEKAGTLLVCPAKFKRVAGYRPKDMKLDDIPFRLYFDEDAAGIARLARVEVDLKWGRASAFRGPPPEGG